MAAGAVATPELVAYCLGVGRASCNQTGITVAAIGGVEGGPVGNIAVGSAALRPYSLFLCSALHTDLHNPEHCEWVLKDIARLESGGIEHTEWDGQGFQHYISCTTVTLEHTIFGECPEWPTWHCSLSRYKAALVAWKLFLEMPISIDSEVIVELPND